MASQSSSTGTVTSSFDAFGDQVTQGPETHVTDGLGRLTSATDSAAGPAYNFSYDGTSGTIASDGVNTYTWDPSGSSLVGVGTPGGSTTGALALTNAHGDVIGQFTASGTSVSGSTAYDPWGNVAAASRASAGRLGCQSGWTDPATGKVAMGARWYDPSNGDFTSADTVQVSPVPDPAMADPFAYAGDDPLDGTDPSGHCGGMFSFAWLSGVARHARGVACRARGGVGVVLDVLLRRQLPRGDARGGAPVGRRGGAGGAVGGPSRL